MSTPLLTPSQATTIGSTVPLLASHGHTITKNFYATLLRKHPSLKNIFNTTHEATGHQALALANALHAYASNIDALGNLGPALELICNKHVSLSVQPEHYAVVGEGLLRAMKENSGSEVATEEVMGAWEAAYWQLAHLMIAKEKGLYNEAKVSQWQGWKDFRIMRKENESDEICSFYLEPAEEGFELPLFKPGQYVSVNIFVEELDGGVWQARQYSLSDAPGKKYLRISVKKEPGQVIGDPKAMTHPGYLSNILHEEKNVGDVVQVSHPFGDFYFDDESVGKETPVVLISAGVGLTCLMSILNALSEQRNSRPISWIHGAKNSRTRAFKKSVTDMTSANDKIHCLLSSSNPEADEVVGEDYHVKGRVDLADVESEYLMVDDSRTQYFVCGPTEFMLDVEKKLMGRGVAADRIKMELFSTGGVPRA